MQKPAVRRVFAYILGRSDKPNSVQAEAMLRLGTIIYLGQLLPAASSGAPARTHPMSSSGTALHRGKDLAVSALRRHRDALRESTYPFGISRFCSHLVDCSRRALPATLLRAKRASVRTFLCLLICFLWASSDRLGRPNS